MSAPSTLVCRDGIRAAQDSLATHGFCVISLADHLDYAEMDAALTSLGDWCKKCDAYMDDHPNLLMSNGRSHDPEEYNLRYSMNDYNNWSYDAWLQMVDLLRPIFEVLIGHGIHIKSLGGDTVRAHAHSDQDIHADGWAERPSAAYLMKPEWFVASVAVHDIVFPPDLEHDFQFSFLCFLMKMPPWENASLGKCIPGKMPPWENASQGKCLPGKCPPGKMPPWENAVLMYTFGSKSYNR